MKSIIVYANDKMRDKLRRTFVSELNSEEYNLEEKGLISLDDKTIEFLVFNTNGEIVLDKEYLKLIDLSNACFDGKMIKGYDFSGLNGVMINPQTIKDRNCSCVNFNGVVITNSFDNCSIYYSKFGGSIGAIIDPQTIISKCCWAVSFKDVIIMGSFNDVNIGGASFEGSKNAIVNPSKVLNGNCRFVNFKDATIIGSFDNCLTLGMVNVDINIYDKIKSKYVYARKRK